jgi:hypothetical protein
MSQACITGKSRAESTFDKLLQLFTTMPSQPVQTNRYNHRLQVLFVSTAR